MVGSAAPVLYLGNKNYSSWSLRPWLALKWGGIAFTEHLLPLGGDHYGLGTNPALLAVSPTGRVPALVVGGVVIHDSLAICEWAAEQAPSLWPEAPLVRAEARAVAAEMHSGFAALRRDLSMNLRRRVEREPPWPDDTRADLRRLLACWEGLRARFAIGGPWLFGGRSIADAMFVPVASRLRTYAVPQPALVSAYVDTALADADVAAWIADAAREPWTIASTDALYPPT